MVVLVVVVAVVMMMIDAHDDGGKHRGAQTEQKDFDPRTPEGTGRMGSNSDNQSHMRDDDGGDGDDATENRGAGKPGKMEESKQYTYTEELMVMMLDIYRKQGSRKTRKDGGEQAIYRKN
jgi:hypothetical protein